MQGKLLADAAAAMQQQHFQQQHIVADAHACSLMPSDASTIS
jgi:hypothetical protein